MPDKAIEAVAERVERPKRPEMWLVVYLRRDETQPWGVMSYIYKSLASAERDMVGRNADEYHIIHIEAEQ